MHLATKNTFSLIQLLVEQHRVHRYGTVVSGENISVCVYSKLMWVCPLQSLYKLVSTTGATLIDAEAFVASSATCWSFLTQISCTKGALASFHSLNLCEVSSWSNSTCSSACRSASFDWDRKKNAKTMKIIKYGRRLQSLQKKKHCNTMYKSHNPNFANCTVII